MRVMALSCCRRLIFLTSGIATMVRDEYSPHGQNTTSKLKFQLVSIPVLVANSSSESTDETSLRGSSRLKEEGIMATGNFPLNRKEKNERSSETRLNILPK